MAPSPTRTPRDDDPARPEDGRPSFSGLRPLTPPRTFLLGRYRVVDEIGRGGMASVHLARMDGPGGFQKWVAIKRIHPHMVEREQIVDMFLDEARTAAAINHANVAHVLDLGRDEDTYWIAMEYLHGEPLREVQRVAEERGARLSPEIAARICADAAEGLHAAHELRGKTGRPLGLVHRDVSPHNLFVTYDGQTKVVDFGIAKVADRLSSETLAGNIKGKLAYMSPEQATGGAVDRTTDVFALGVVLWELTTSRRLFKTSSDVETFERVQACVVPRPSTIVPGYPPALEACVMRALAARREDRYPTARDFSRALQRYLAESGRFVGVEEVARLLQAVFGERMREREAQLAWAAGDTGTGGAPPRERMTPASGSRPVAGLSAEAPADLIDDEDVPTMVATRAQLEAGGALPAARWAARAADLGATMALPAEAAPRSPTFAQHAASAPAPSAPVQLALAIARGAPPKRAGRAPIVALGLLVLLGLVGIGAVVAAAIRLGG